MRAALRDVLAQGDLQAFRAALAARGGRTREVAKIEGLNYSKGDPMTLRVYVAPDVDTREAP